MFMFILLNCIIIFSIYLYNLVKVIEYFFLFVLFIFIVFLNVNFRNFNICMKVKSFFVIMGEKLISILL